MSGATDIREVIAEQVVQIVATCDQRAGKVTDYDREWADRIIAAIEAAPVEMRLAWAARLVGPDHVVVPLEPTIDMVKASGIAQASIRHAIQAGAVKGEQ